MKKVFFYPLLIVFLLSINEYPQDNRGRGYPREIIDSEEDKGRGDDSPPLGLIPDTLLLSWRQFPGPVGGGIGGLSSFGDTIIAGVGYNYITFYYSINRGKNWKKSSFNYHNSGQTDFTKIGDWYFAAVNLEGIFKSNDLINWTKVYKDGAAYWSIGSDHENRLYSGIYYNGGILGSKDSGRHWKAETGFTGEVISFITTPKGTSIGSGYGSNSQGKSIIARREKGAANWTSIPLPVSANSHFYLAQNELDSTVFTVAYNRSYCFVSKDDGLTWVNHDTAGFLQNLSTNSFTFSNGTLAAGGSPDLFISGWGIAISTDYGYTWKFSNSGLSPYAQVTRLTSANGEIIAGLQGGGIYRSTDNGNNWIPSMEGLAAAGIGGFIFDHDSTLIATAWGLGVNVSTDRGITWETRNNGFSDYKIFSIIEDTAGLYFAGGQSGIYKSTNKGINWTKSANIFPGVLAKDSQNRIYATWYDAGVFRSTNHGDSWVSMNDGLEDLMVYSLFVDTTSGNLLSGHIRGTIYLSDNGGQNWRVVRRYNDAASTVSDFDVDEEGTIYTCNYKDGVLKSTDHGENWTLINSNLPTKKIYMIKVSKKGELFAGAHSGGLYYSNDKGKKWYSVTQNLKNITVGHMIFDNNNKIYMGTDEGLWTGDKPSSIISEPVNMINSYLLEQNYPNPFNPLTRIKFSIPEAGIVTLKVYDLLGRNIHSLIEEYKPGGDYEAEFDASNLSSGIYFYTLQVNDFRETKKMVLLK